LVELAKIVSLEVPLTNDPQVLMKYPLVSIVQVVSILIGNGLAIVRDCPAGTVHEMAEADAIIAKAMKTLMISY